MFWKKKKPAEPNWHRLATVFKNALEENGWIIDYGGFFSTPAQTTEFKKAAYKELAQMARVSCVQDRVDKALLDCVYLMLLYGWSVWDLGETGPEIWPLQKAKDRIGLYNFIDQFRKRFIDDNNTIAIDQINKTEDQIIFAINAVRAAANLPVFCQ